MIKFNPALLGGLLLVGCSQGPEGVPPESESPDESTSTTASRLVLAEVKVSDTHRIQFIEYPELDLVVVDERFHADLDGWDSSLRAQGLTPEDPLDEIYVVAAREQVDWSVAERLRGVQDRLDAGALVEVPVEFEQEPTVIDDPQVVSQDDAVSPASDTVSLTSEGLIGQHSQAACAEPSWEWLGDEAWFKENFCRNGFQYCDALDPAHMSHSVGRHLESYHFNQSFCSAATLRVDYRVATSCSWLTGCTRRTFHGAEVPVPNRFVAGQWHTKASKDADGKWPGWWSRITSAQGNFTGLASFIYTN